MPAGKRHDIPPRTNLQSAVTPHEHEYRIERQISGQLSTRSIFPTPPSSAPTLFGTVNSSGLSTLDEIDLSNAALLRTVLFTRSRAIELRKSVRWGGRRAGICTVVTFFYKRQRSTSCL